MQSVDLKAVLAGVGLAGCVQSYLEGFATELVSAGYSVLTARDFLRSAAHRMEFSGRTKDKYQ